MPNNFYGVNQNVHLPPIMTRIQKGKMVYNTNSTKPISFTSKPVAFKSSFNMGSSTRKLNIFAATKIRNMRRSTRRTNMRRNRTRRN
jgi:hypothetical protein